MKQYLMGSAAMNEEHFSEKISGFLSKSEKYKTMVKPSIRMRLQRLGELLGGEAGAFTTGAVGSAALSAAGLVSGMGVLVTIPLFCIGTMFGYAFSVGVGKSLEYACKHFDPNDPVRQKHITKTIEMIQQLHTKELSPSMQSSLKQAVTLLSDKDIPPAFWSELNPLLEESKNWYKTNHATRSQIQQFDTQVSEFQRQFDLSKASPQNVKVQAHAQEIQNPTSINSTQKPTIIKL